MKPIRAWRDNKATYFEMFREASGMTYGEYLSKHSGKIPNQTCHTSDCTDALTAMREYFASNGYAKEIEETDKRFLAEHHGYSSEDSWERFWRELCERFNLDPRKDAL